MSLSAPPVAAEEASSPPTAAAPAAASGEARGLDDGDLSPPMIAKLSGEELARVLVAREERRDGGSVKIAVPLAFFAFILLSIIAGLYAGFRKDRQRHETIRAMIERGAAIPPELLVAPVNPHSDFRRGALLLAGGLGLAVFLAAVAPPNGVWTLGLVPALIGLGHLLVWRVTRSNPRGASTQS